VLANLMAIVLFEVVGDLLQKVTGLPVPGPVIGMAALLVSLILVGRLPAGLERAASGLLAYLPLLFVPAGVGVIEHFDLIRAEWPAIAVAIVVSSIVAVATTAATMRGVERWQQALRAPRQPGIEGTQ